jgi:PAS domain S-box-containing protein
VTASAPIIGDVTPPRGVSRHLEFIANRVPALLAYVTADGWHRYANRAYEEWFGLTRQEIANTTMIGLWGEVAYRAMRPHVEAALAGQTERFVLTVILPGLGERCVAVNLIPHVSAERGVSGFVSHMLDITHQHREEAARDQLISVLGHDLRNPLSAILVSVSHMLDVRDLPDALLRSATRIAASAKRMSRILDDLLDFSMGRFLQGIPVVRSPGDLELICRRVVDELTVVHPHHAVQIAAHGDLRGQWDSGRLGQAVSNLVANAVKHGADPIRLVADGGRPDTVRVEVANGGPPIPSDLMPILFRPFVSKSDGRPGLGLGLYVVQEIARAHGGTIEVHSSAEEGTRFVMTIPRRPRKTIPEQP